MNATQGRRPTLILPVLFGLFAGSVVATNAASVLVIHVGPLVFTCGSLLYPVTFLFTDTISEVYGQRAAAWAVWTGFAAQIAAIGFILLSSLFPALDPATAEAWRATLMPVGRLALASMAAYLVAQHIDVRIFHALSRLTRGRHLWLRNNGSTLVSQSLDTLIFNMLAFAGLYDADTLLAMVASQYVWKAGAALLDTPLCYLAVWYVKGRENG